MLTCLYEFKIKRLKREFLEVRGARRVCKKLLSSEMWVANNNKHMGGRLMRACVCVCVQGGPEQNTQDTGCDREVGLISETHTHTLRNAFFLLVKWRVQ